MQRRPPIDYIARTKAQYDALGYPSYNWVTNPAPPRLAPLRKPLSESRLALIGSGGIYRVGQTAFHFKDDLSYREIDTTQGTTPLRATHFAYDLTDARQDPNVVFPIDTLQRCAEEGLIGGLATPAYAFMGGIYSSRKVAEALAPELVRRILQQRARDEVDVVLLVPV